MKTFEETDRYIIPSLTADSIVLDFGAYQGNWGRLIAEKYGCHVHCFEPIKAFFDDVNIALKRHPLAHLFTVHHMGVGPVTGKETFRVKGCMSGIVADGPEEEVFLIGIAELMNNPIYDGKSFGAVKFNIEGSEFPVMEAMFEHGLMSRVDVLHVQFHDVVPRAVQRMEHIKNMMLMTHRPVFDAGMVWCGWEAKP